MSKWEDKYEEYKNGKIEKLISTKKGQITRLNNQIENRRLKEGETYRDVSKELKAKQEELNKLVAIKENMPKINNIIQYRDELKKELNELQQELNTRKSLEEANEKMRNAEKQIDELQNEHAEIAKQLRNPELTPEKRVELQGKQKEINSKMAKAQDDRQANEDVLKGGLGQKRELSDLSKEEIEKKTTDLETKISKCNLVAHNLLEGNDWDHINAKLDNWQNKTFTSNDEKLKAKIEQKREQKVNDFMENYNPNYDENFNDKETTYTDEKPENGKPALTFADKHPRLAKIGNFFKGIKDRFIKKEKDDTVNTESKKPAKRDTSVEDKVAEEKSFKEYIREIAEKGMDGIAAEEKEARQQEAKRKLAEMRKVNRIAEAVKYGEEYAKQSDPRTQDDVR